MGIQLFQHYLKYSINFTKTRIQDVFTRIKPRISQRRKRRKGQEQGKIKVISSWTSISSRKNSSTSSKRKLRRESRCWSTSLHGRCHGIFGCRSSRISR